MEHGLDLSATDLTLKYYKFPFEFYPFQKRTIDELALLPRSGWYLDMGLGKTAMATAAALYKTLVGEANRVLIIVPPILITAWGRFLASVQDRETGPLDVLLYRGTKAARAKLTLDHDIVVVGIQIFKKDFSKFWEAYRDVPTVIVVDEAHALKNAASDNHRKIWNMMSTGILWAAKKLMLLTGTAINSPMDAYGMIQLVSPDTYTSYAHFERTHVASWDWYDRPEEYKELELLESNLRKNAVRLLKEDVIADMPPISYQPLFYDWDAEHFALYKRMYEVGVLPLKGGGKLDFTQVSAFFQAMSQVVCNWAYYAEDESKVPNAFRLVDEIMDELGDGKLVLFAQYRRTNQAATKYFQKYNPVAIYGDIPSSERDAALDRFVSDPSCRMFIGNPKSAGYGIDRLQHVASTVAFLEPPNSISDFTQAVSRVHRIGQTKPVVVKMFAAEQSIQMKQLESLLRGEDLATRVTGGKMTIMQALGLEAEGECDGRFDVGAAFSARI